VNVDSDCCPKPSPAPVLILAWGNPSRGDDALGPLFVERLRVELGDADVEWLSDFQLQIEHALDLAGRQRVLFVDASANGDQPFSVTPVLARRDVSFTSHALSPAAVLQVLSDIEKCAPPVCTLLAIRGDSFELGQALTEAAVGNLALALRWGRAWVTGKS
jgi:hydrogenase maturation protease